LLWGPDYCSASRYAREFDSAEHCRVADASVFLETILDLKNNPARQQVLIQNAQKMYADRFHPDRIHGQFVHHTLKLLGTAA
jgi:hypothetical protein